MTPARGLCLIRKPALESTYAGGSIQLLDKTVDAWAGGQAEVVAVGEPEIPEDEEDVDPLDPLLVPGAWVVCRLRTWVEASDPGTYVIRQSDVVGTFIEGENA